MTHLAPWKSAVLALALFSASANARDSHLSITVDLGAVAPEAALVQDVPSASAAPVDSTVDTQTLRREGGVPPARGRVPSPDELLVVMFAADGSELHRRVIPNPAIVRGEFPGDPATGSQIPAGQTRFTLPDARARLELPDIEGASRVVLMQSVVEGTRESLKILWSVELQ